MFMMNYRVCGTIRSQSDDTRLKISGYMVIDNRLRLWEGSTTSSASLAPLALDYLQYSYFISEYSFSIYSFAISNTSPPNTTYSFSGTAGSLYMERSSGGAMGDLMWFLENGTGNWTNWTGEDFFCFHEDLTAYDLYNEMHELAPIIRLTNLDYIQNDTILNPPVWCDILLTKTGPVGQDTPQVPPPPTGFAIK